MPQFRHPENAGARGDAGEALQQGCCAPTAGTNPRSCRFSRGTAAVPAWRPAVSGDGDRMAGLLRACLLSLLLLPWHAAWPPGLGSAVALAQARSSGGYSRPQSGYGRTPSFGGPRVAPRTPSGGYGLPPSGYSRRPSVNAPLPGTGSAWDRGYSQERSA